MQRTSAVWLASRLLYMLAAGIVIAFAVLMVWRAGVFMTLRLRLNDTYYAPAPTTGNIVIVAADDAALDRYGRTPVQWSRTVYADLANALLTARPRVLAFDFLLSDADPQDSAVSEALVALRQSDARTRVVLADAGVGTVGLPPVSEAGAGMPALHFANRLGVSESLLDAADYLGFVNALPDIDGVLRRQPSLISAADRTGVSFSMAIYLAYLRIPSSAASQLIEVADGVLSLTPDRQLPVDGAGMWLPYFFAPPSSYQSAAFEVVSLVDVLDGRVPVSTFTDKIVMVGLMDTTGSLDEYLVPASSSGSLMPGVEIQAHAVESLLQGRFIRPPSDIVQVVVLVAMVLVASLAYALPRWTVKVFIAGMLLLAWFVGASIVFSLTSTPLSLLDGIFALLLPLLVSVGIDITLETVRRKQTEFLLESVRRIAQQRLRLQQAAGHILADVRRIAPVRDAVLYVWDELDPARSARFEDGGAPVLGEAAVSSIAPELRQLHELTSAAGQTAVPVLWQGRQLALLVIRHAAPQLDRVTRLTLASLAENLAPHIDNMLLYDAVKRQRSLLDSVFAESPAGLAVLSPEGRVIRSNQDLLRLLEVEQAELDGRLLADVLRTKASATPDVYERLRIGFAGSGPFTMEELKLGGLVVRVSMAPLHDGELRVVVLADVTALAELSNLKTRMLRIASHDLKNPLARIKGFVELILLMSSTITERERKHLEMVNAAGDEMLRIIEDILDLERLRSGKLMLNDVNLSQIVREVCARHQPDLIHKNQQMDIDIPDHVITVRADAAQISQAVNNYVGNAIKYTPEGGHVHVRMHSSEGWVRLEVQDTGYGIPEKAQPHIFSEFYRAKAEGTLHIAGTGLGLSLVKSVIESHGGKVGFSSTEGVGSTFYFVLPELHKSGGAA